MSLLPYIVNELVRDSYDRYDPFSPLYDQHFGLGLLNDDLYRRPAISAFSTPVLAGYLRPHRHSHPENSGISTIVNQKDQFKVNLDVQQFKPEEVNVKIVDDYLVVEGKHEERQDKHGYISRQFTRRYKLPQNVNLEAIASNLSSDGILSITAPKKAEKNEAKEISIPVVQTNQPAIKQTNKNEEKSAGDKMET
uniref:Putative small heat shock protein n=1 Tax=Maconellicoccus hirsutus TaxID=177089 RepID=A2I3W3_MACHI|nr:putative small heat shock protein [Maconellicoccus hirsutus]